MTTTLSVSPPYTRFSAQGYDIVQSPGTAVPDGAVPGILQAAVTAGVFITGAAGTGTTFAGSRRYVSSGTGAPSVGTWTVGDEVADSTGTVYECTAGGSPGTWVTPGSGTSVPTTGTYTRDSSNRVTAEPDGTTYTYDDTNGGRVATISKSGTTRTAQYTNDVLTGWV